MPRLTVIVLVNASWKRSGVGDASAFRFYDGQRLKGQQKNKQSPLMRIQFKNQTKTISFNETNTIVNTYREQYLELQKRKMNFLKPKNEVIRIRTLIHHDHSPAR